MSLLFWNVRGLGTKWRQNEPEALLTKWKIEVFGIMEPKLKLESTMNLQSDMPEWALTSNLDAIEQGNRTSIIFGCQRTQWTSQLLLVQTQLLHLWVTNVGSYCFNLIVVYGERDLVGRMTLWDGIVDARLVSKGVDWLVAGDFNAIRTPHEREGRDPLMKRVRTISAWLHHPSPS